MGSRRYGHGKKGLTKGWTLRGWDSPTVPSSTGHLLPSANPSRKNKNMSRFLVSQTKNKTKGLDCCCCFFFCCCCCCCCSYIHHVQSLCPGLITDKLIHPELRVIFKVLGLDTQKLTGDSAFTYICFFSLWNMWVNYTIHWVSVFIGY